MTLVSGLGRRAGGKTEEEDPKKKTDPEETELFALHNNEKNENDSTALEISAIMFGLIRGLTFNVPSPSRSRKSEECLEATPQK